MPDDPVDMETVLLLAFADLRREADEGRPRHMDGRLFSDAEKARYDSATDAERQAVEQHRQAAGDYHQARRAGRQRLTDIALSLAPEIYGPFISEIMELPHVDTGDLTVRQLGEADQAESAAWSERFRRMILPYLTGDVRTRALAILEQLGPGESGPGS
jgi:hypothetical protein